MKQIRLKDCTYIIKEGMKRVVSVILSREDKVLESLIMDMDYDVVQEWIEEEEERRRINK